MSKPSKVSELGAAGVESIKLDTPDIDVCSDRAAEVREYIADMAAGLAELAYASRLEALAMACDVVREIAEGNMPADTRLVRLS